MQGATGFSGINLDLASSEKTIAQQAGALVIEGRPTAVPVDLAQNVEPFFRWQMSGHAAR